MNSVTSIGRWHLCGGAAVLAALMLTGAPTGFAQESLAIRASLVAGSLPVDDPNASAWTSAAPATFPMSPQVHWPDRIQEVTVQDVIIRALHDGKQIAFLLEYADPTQDVDDAAAIEFMVGDKKAHFAHGQPMLQVEGGPVNIWFWKNKDGQAVDMTAKGFGTLKPQSHQDVHAKGDYANGKWKIVFSRPLATDHPDEDMQVKLGEFINVAFAVWDGRKDATGQVIEKGSQKAVSSWWYFQAEPPPDYSAYLYAGVAVVLALGFQFVLIRKLKEGQ